MKRLAGLALLTLLFIVGCKPSTPVASGDSEENPVVDKDGHEVTPPKNNGGEVTDKDLPANPARDLSAEQKQVDAMDIAALVEALGDDKLYLVAVDELKTRGPEAVEPLTAALDSEDEEKRQSAMLALGMLGEHAKSALPKLKAIAADDDQSEVIISTAANAVDSIEGN
jgi:HEAT repeat protein